MSYRPVDERFWKDDKVRGLPTNAKLLFLYFISCPSAHYSGLYYIPICNIVFETGLSENEVRKGINTLSEGYMISYDYSTSEVFVTNMALFQALNDKQLKGIASHLKKGVQSKELIHKFHKKHSALKIPYQYPIEPTETDIKTDIKTDMSIVSPVGDTSQHNPAKDGDVGFSLSQKPKTPYEAIRDAYHEICVDLPRCKTLSDKRKRMLDTAWKIAGKNMDVIREALMKAQASPFLRGEKNDPTGKYRRFKADFEFVFAEKNFSNILDGRYDDDWDVNDRNKKTSSGEMVLFGEFPEE